MGGQLPQPYVVVAMSDPDLEQWQPDGEPCLHVVRGPVSDHGLPLAAARNLGIELAVRQGAEVVVGLDVDCMADPDLVAAYEDAVVHDPQVLWSGPVTYLSPEAEHCSPLDLGHLDDPHPGRPAPRPGQRWVGGEPDHFWSLSFALHADAWTAVDGFCERYVGYGGEDTDFSRTWAASGRALGWVGDARAYHQHHPTQNPPVQHLDDILRNAGIFAERWGHWPMRGWLEAFRDAGLAMQEPDGRWVRRDEPAQRQVRA
jgi:hypothetical protein